MVLAAARPGLRGTAVTAFAPTSLAGLALWLDAGQITGATDAAPVTNWQDLSINGYNATQATAAKQPTYRSTGTLLTPTGKPVVQFDGVATSLDCSAGTTQPSQTAFVVARATSFPATTDPTYTFLASTTNGGFAFQLSSTGTTIRVEDDSLAGRYNASYSPGTTLFHQYSATYDSAAGTHIYSDGAELGAGGGSTGAFGGSGFRRIGSCSSGSVASKTFAGVMAEIVVYTRILTTVERKQVEAYLKTKHGTP